MLNSATINHLRLVVGRELKTALVDLPVQVKIPVEKYDTLLRASWARAIGMVFCEKFKDNISDLLRLRLNNKLEMLHAIQDFMEKHKNAPTENQWAAFIAKHNGSCCKSVISHVEKYFPRTMPTRYAWDESVYLRSTARIILNKQGTWKEPILKLYSEHLNSRQAKFQNHGWIGDNERFTSKSKVRFFRTIVVFLDYLEAELDFSHISQLTPNAIDKFSFYDKNNLSGVKILIDLLQRKGMVDRTIKITKPPQKPNIHALLLPKEVADITSLLLAEADTDSIQEALVGLLVLHYDQTTLKATSLRIENIGWDENKLLTIRFAKVDIVIQTLIAEKLSIWLKKRSELLKERGDNDNPYLFVDRHLSLPLCCNNIPKKFSFKNVNLVLWRTSAILNAYRNGVRQAKVLVDAFGISMNTALKYQSVFGELIRDQVSVKR